MKNTLNNLKSNKRFLGFITYSIVYVILFSIPYLFSKSDFDAWSYIPGTIGFILFIAILYGLTVEKYKKYTQGALWGWLIFFVVSILFIFIN